MSDLFNNFPSWGETGSYPNSGFFYEGGDQVNEKHLDALWNGLDVHISNLNTAIRDRIRDLDGDVVLDQGLTASTGDGTREVDVTASTAGAYVDGQKTGSVSATTVTFSANGTTSTRTDVVYLNQDATIGTTSGATSPPAGTLKIAEVDVDPNDTITAVRNYARDAADHIASENAPTSPEPGDVWHDLTNNAWKIRVGSAWQEVFHGGNDGPGSGLDADSVDGKEPPFSPSVSDSGTQVLAVPTDLNFGSLLNITDDGDGTVTIDAASQGHSVSDSGTLILSGPSDVNFGTNLTVTDDTDGTVTVDGPTSVQNAATVDGNDGATHYAGSLPRYADATTGLNNTTEGDLFYNNADNSTYLNDGT